MIRGGRVDVLGNLGVDFDSRRHEDYVDVLNRVAAALGAVPNMGVYADITKVSGTTMLKVDTKDRYLDIDTRDMETPKKSKTNRHNIRSVMQANLDMFVGDGTAKGVLDGTIENHQCSVTVDCDVCNGRGKCGECDGAGKVECVDCHGDGDCHQCDAKGWEECYLCHGSGDCPSCGGSGWSHDTCPDCGGSGKVVDETTGRKRKCDTCGGRGVMPCEACAPTARVPSRKPGKCPVCLGKGDLKCRTCDGTGKCRTCKGKGTVACEKCGGTGKCTKCKGSGKLKCPRCEGSGWYQTYTVFEAKQVVKENEWVSHEDYAKVLCKAQGRNVFSGRLKKWQKVDVVEYDHTGRLRAAVAAADGGDSRAVEAFLSDHEASVKRRYGIHYCVDAEAEVVSAVRIDFVLERVPLSMVIVGHNGVVLHSALPRRISQYRVGLFKRISMYFSRKSRHMEYIRLAAYIMQLDGRSPEESRLLNAFVRSLGYGNAKSKRLMSELGRFNSTMDYASLRGEIRHLLPSRRVLTFAWHCMLRDGCVSEAERSLWQQLAAEFELADSDAESLKRNAGRLAQLSDEQIVAEYMRV